MLLIKCLKIKACIKKVALLAVSAALFCMAGCGTRDQHATSPPAVKDAYRNVYEVFVGSFYDSDGDGIGDLPGLLSQLDYITNPETGLGADAIWMMPIMPSPSYHKYDVTDYKAIDPVYGTMEDFEALMEACNERGVAVLIDLVLNHTSFEHPWFLEAQAEIQEKKDLHYFNFYNFTTGKVSSDYYPVDGGYYYEALFWSGMPDLNYDNGDVRTEISDIARFWLDKGVAGFRLDAAKHVYNTSKENISFWTWFTETCRTINPEVYLVAEVWDNDAAMVPYYASGLDSLFNFGFAGTTGAIANCISRENGRDLATRIENYDIVIKKQNPSAINAIFLSNHDQDRSAGYFYSDEERMKLAATVYLLIPGTSYIYYGEEIGLTGKGKDENKRAPFIFSVTDKTGQTLGPVDMTERPNLTEGAAEQMARAGSLLNRYRAVLALKNKYPAMARGIPKAIKTDEKSISLYAVTYENQHWFIVHNLSQEAKTVSAAEMAGASLVDSFTNGTVCEWDGTALQIPGYGTAVLRLADE